jgi:hypothetical protein
MVGEEEPGLHGVCARGEFEEHEEAVQCTLVVEVRPEVTEGSVFGHELLDYLNVPHLELVQIIIVLLPLTLIALFHLLLLLLLLILILIPARLA